MSLTPIPGDMSWIYCDFWVTYLAISLGLSYLVRIVFSLADGLADDNVRFNVMNLISLGLSNQGPAL